MAKRQQMYQYATISMRARGKLGGYVTLAVPQSTLKYKLAMMAFDLLRAAFPGVETTYSTR